MSKLLWEIIEKVDNEELYKKRKENEVLIESFFKREKNNFNLKEAVNSIFDELFALHEQNLLTEDVEEVEERVIKFPKIRITENWGKVDNEDRELLETLMANIKGGTVQEKIDSVSDFIEYQPELDIPTIMSHLMFLEIFSAIIEEYNYATAGFLFEAFLAGLFKGIQVDDPEQVGATPGSLPIEDVRLAIRQKDEVSDSIVPYSLKVLSPGTDLKGSFTNLVDYFADPAPERYNESIVYLVVTKKGQGTLSFHEFSITAENWLEYIGYEKHAEQDIIDSKDFAGQELIDDFGIEMVDNKRSKFHEKYIVRSKAEAAEGFENIKVDLASDLEIPVEEIELVDIELNGESVLGGVMEFSPGQTYTVKFRTGSEFAGTGKLTANAKHLYGSMEVMDKLRDMLRQKGPDAFWNAMKNVRGYRKNEQFHIAPTYFRHPKRAKHLGDIDLYKPRLIQLANKYALDLTAELINIYNALDALSMNINKYFLAEEGNNKQYGKEAVRDAKILYNNTKKAVGK